MTLPFAIPTLQTARLTLRAPSEDDFAAMLAFNHSPRAGFLGGGADDHAIWRGLLSNIGHWALRGHGFYSVDTHAGDFIGRVGVVKHHTWPEPELAWQLFDGFEGHGYASEAAIAARADAYTRLHMPPMVSYVDPANTRSAATARNIGARVELETTMWDHAVHIYRHPAAESVK